MHDTAPSFRRKRSGVEKSHAERWQAHGWQEISRLCVSLEPKVLVPHTGAFLPQGGAKFSGTISCFPLRVAKELDS